MYLHIVDVIQVMKTVYILGAGFSRDWEPSKFPLVRDFFQIARTTGAINQDDYDKDLNSYIHKFFHTVEGADLEKVMCFLSIPPFNASLSAKTERLNYYSKLIKVITNVLQNAHHKASREEVQNLYTKFIDKAVSEQSIIISFNYDLLVDTLLHKTGLWCGYDGYGIEIPSVYQALPKPARVSKGIYNPDKRSKTYLLKLHGSINWGTATHNPSENKSIFQEAGGYYFKDYKNGVNGPSIISSPEVTSITDLPLRLNFEPYIIPPILDKSSFINGNEVKLLWKIARDAIAKATQIIFIGYSLPPTDFMAEFLFRSSFVDKPPKDIEVINKSISEEMKSRYGSLSPLKEVTYTEKTFADWAKSI